MTKRCTFKKTKLGEPIPVTARQLESFILEHNGRFNSRDYDRFERMKLTESPVRDAIHECLDNEDDSWYHFSLAYIPRALNNRDMNDAIIQMFFIAKWKVHKFSLWAEPEDIMHCGNDSNKAFW